MKLRWDDLRLFLAVHEQGSLSGAARMLKLGQPTLSRRIAELETMVGEALFERQSQGASLRIPRHSATRSTVIRPPVPRASGRVSRSEATQGFQVKVLSCRLSIFLFPCAWFFRSN